MKSLYNSPEIDITTFSPEDIISTSIAITDAELNGVNDTIDFDSIK
ncbi:MAG: hypothetical protein IJ062_02785 [Firmicutes bacterium]|nr:hypothetical protein [Bacillota bacterium]